MLAQGCATGCIGKLLRKEAQGTIQLHCLAAAHHRGWLVQDDRELKWEFSTRGKRWLKGEAVQAQRGGAPLEVVEDPTLPALQADPANPPAEVAETTKPLEPAEPAAQPLQAERSSSALRSHAASSAAAVPKVVEKEVMTPEKAAAAAVPEEKPKLNFGGKTERVATCRLCEEARTWAQKGSFCEYCTGAFRRATGHQRLHILFEDQHLAESVRQESKTKRAEAENASPPKKGLEKKLEEFLRRFEEVVEELTANCSDLRLILQRNAAQHTACGLLLEQLGKLRATVPASTNLDVPVITLTQLDSAVTKVPLPQEALTAAGYTLTKHSAAAAAEGPKSQQRKRGRRTKVNSVEMVSLVRRVLAPHLQDTERVGVVGRGRNKKMVVAQHLRKKRYRVFLEEPELHESMSWSTFHSIMKRHFPHVKNPMRQTDICEHCKHLERHLLPAAQRALAKHRLEIEEFSQQYFHPFDSSPATIENKEKTDKFPLLATSLAFVQQQNFNAANSRERQALGLATRLALHSAEASAIHTLKGHVELLEAYRWHQTSARRQEAALEQLASGESLPASAVLLQMDFKAANMLVNEVKVLNVEVEVLYLAEHHGKGACDRLFAWTRMWVSRFIQKHPIYNLRDLTQCYREGAASRIADDPTTPAILVSNFDPGRFRPTKRSFLSAATLKISRTYSLVLGPSCRAWWSRVLPCHVDEVVSEEKVEWRRGYYDKPRSWEQAGPEPGDVNHVTRRFAAQKTFLPAKQLSKHAAKKKRQLAHLKRRLRPAEAEGSSSSASSSSSSSSTSSEKA
ncbi:unnamed protein product [Effrenium voratum]|uniref:Uncharacterized protein n=1 Tax=Effrenium voratum TaxID=2562239 RepID=A0AA36HS42_9DINO|nr:unnamed protein product [Effrenium voratum]